MHRRDARRPAASPRDERDGIRRGLEPPEETEEEEPEKILRRASQRSGLTYDAPPLGGRVAARAPSEALGPGATP